MRLNTIFIQRRGLDCFVGPLEAAILRAFWQGARSTRGAFEIVRDTYAARKSDDIRFTTITTTVTRLYDRGFFTRTGDKTGYIYAPVHKTEAEFVAEALRITLTALFESYPRETGAILVDIVRNARSNNG